MNEQVTNEKSVATVGSDTAALSKQDTNFNTSFNALNLFDEKQVVAAEAFLKRMITTEKSGIKNVNEGLAILMRAQDLQLPFSSCIEHIHVIQGKTGIDIHIIRSLLSRAGVTWECTKDYAPQYQYTDGNTIYNETQLPDYCVKCRTADEAIKVDGDKIGVYPVRWYQDLKGNIYNEFQINDKCTLAINKQQALKFAQEGKYPIVRIPAVPIDYVTEYKFTRRKIILGEKVITTSTGHFSLSEARVAGLVDNKDTYQKYPRIMVGIRAFTYGARDIADDALMGYMETSELKIATNTPLDGSEFVDAEVIN